MSKFLSRNPFIDKRPFTTIKVEMEGVTLKKWIKLFIILTLMLSVLLCHTPTSHASSENTATVTADILNVREQPTVKAKKLGTVKKGTKITVYKQTKSGWAEIHYKTKKAYVFSKYLKFAAERASFLFDKTKVYTYTGAKGTYRLIPSGEKFHQWDIWYYSSRSSTKQAFLVSEDHNGLYTGYINSESYIDIKYPVKVGQKWDVGYEGAGKARITSTDKTIKTPVGTYKDGLEVKDDYGYTFYFAKHIGLVKCLYKGKTYSELTNIRKKE